MNSIDFWLNVECDVIFCLKESIHGQIESIN